MEKKEGAQKGAGIPFKEEGDLEGVRSHNCMEVEDEAERRRKLGMNRGKSSRRSYERLT